MNSTTGSGRRGLKWGSTGMLGLAFLLGLSSCSNPQIRIRSTPSNALVLRDGFPAGHSPMTMEAPYYGTILIEIEKAPMILVLDNDDRTTARRESTHWKPVTRMVHIPPPVGRWAFPFDLPGELLYRLFGLLDSEIDVRLQTQDAPQRLDDKSAAQLIKDSQKASIGR